MFANNRTESTKCLIKRPTTSITQIMANNGGRSKPGTSIGGTMPTMNPFTPIAWTPANRTNPSTKTASMPVTLMLPVAEAPPGIIPAGC